MMLHLINRSPATACISLPTCKGLLLIPANQIVRIQSISNYSKLYFANGKSVVVAKVLRWFEESPCLAGFIRIHRTHLVNPAYIDGCGVLSPTFLQLTNGEQLKIARRKKVAVLHRLMQANGNAEKTVAVPFGSKPVNPAA